MTGISPLAASIGDMPPKKSQVRGGFRVPFCDPTEGILKFLFGDVFCMRGDPLKKKTDPRSNRFQHAKKGFLTESQVVFPMYFAGVRYVRDRMCELCKFEHGVCVSRQRRN